MNLVKREIVLVFLFMMMAFCGFCKCNSVYKVGDSAGWAVLGNVDYNAWAASKPFQVGDTIVFEYDPRYHNVLQVRRSEFHSCTTTAPIATFATGNDSITIRSSGHYYYICGFVGHCQAGQKVDIRVPRPGRPATVPISGPAPGPNQAPAPIGPLTPSPAHNSAQPLLLYNRFFYSIVGLSLVLVFMVLN